MAFRYGILAFSYVFIRIAIPLVEKLFIGSGFLKENYRGDLIPCSMGIIFTINTLFISLFLLKFQPKSTYVELLMIVIGIITMGFIGLIDDFIGDSDVKGFKGHIKMLFSMKLTTGGLKAVVGGVISILISLIVSMDLVNFLINIIIISLFTNLINLLDLRPGRALKSFLIISLPIVFFIEDMYQTVLLSFMAAALAYLPYDIKGRSMLGDTGANSLGILLGIIATSFSLKIRIAVVIFLILSNLYSEKYSISRLISGNKILSFIDELGR